MGIKYILFSVKTSRNKQLPVIYVYIQYDVYKAKNADEITFYKI